MLKPLILLIFLTQAPMGGPVEDPMDVSWGILRDKRIASELKLTPDQQKKIADIHYSYSKKVVDLRAEIQKKAIDLNKIIESEDFTREQIEPLVKEIANLEAELRINRLMELGEMRKVLTQEQRDKLRELMRERMRILVKERQRYRERQ